MKHSEIIEVSNEIKKLIMKGKTELAITKAVEFVSILDDNTLEDQIISLSSRYSRFNKGKIQGITSDENNKEMNSIDASLVSLLREAKQIAIEKASLDVGAQLSELAEIGSNAIEELKELNVIIAESRLLELQVMRSMFESFFSSKDLQKFDENIDSLKKVLNKKDEDYIKHNENNSSDFITKLHQNFEKVLPDGKPSVDDLMSLVNQMKDRIMNESVTKP
jgi:hypothetical protein